MQLLYSLQLLGDFTGVAFWAHIGGFACGAALGTFWKVAYQKRLDQWKSKQRLQIQELWVACLNHETERAHELIEQDNQLPGSQGIKVYLSTLLEDDNDPQLIGKFLIAFKLDSGGLKTSIFVVITLYKAFYIVGEFMHLSHEVKSLIWTIILPLIFVVWLIVALLIQGESIYGALLGL